MLKAVICIIASGILKASGCFVFKTTSSTTINALAQLLCARAQQVRSRPARACGPGMPMGPPSGAGMHPGLGAPQPPLPLGQQQLMGAHRGYMPPARLPSASSLGSLQGAASLGAPLGGLQGGALGGPLGGLQSAGSLGSMGSLQAAGLGGMQGGPMGGPMAGLQGAMHIGGPPPPPPPGPPPGAMW